MQKGVDYVIAGKAYNTTVGGWSTAEGYQTTVTSRYSHAEGYYTTVSNDRAHAEGNHTVASGENSHAEGYYTTAQRRSQHVFGEYNILDTGGNSNSVKGSYIEIVGNGISDSQGRSNARTLDWSGNEWLAGKLTVGAGPTNNMDVATKQYVDAAISTVPTKTSELTNDSGFLTIDSDEKLKTTNITAPTNFDDKIYLLAGNNSIIASTKFALQSIPVYKTTINDKVYIVEQISSEEAAATNFFGGAIRLRQPLSSLSKGYTTIIPSITNYVLSNVVQLPALSGTLALTTDIPTKTSQLTNDSGYITSAPVTSVNGKTGAITLTASDINVDTSNFLSTSGGTLNNGTLTFNNGYNVQQPCIIINSNSADIINQIKIYPSTFRNYEAQNNVEGMLSIDARISIKPPYLSTHATTKGYVDDAITNAISGITSFNASVVNTLPTTDIDTHTIYFISKTGSTNDVYDEYMYINNAWEKIGNTAVDLSGYLQTTDIAAWAKASTKPTYTANEVGALPNTTIIPTKLSDLTNDTGYITSYTETDPVFAASAAAGITSTDISNWNAKVSDDKTWNGVGLAKQSMTSSGSDTYVPLAASLTAKNMSFTPVKSAPTANAITKYDSSAYLSSTTPAATDNSTKVATTAYVTTAISNAATTVTQTLTSGTAIATINGTTIYAPSYTDADGVSY